MSRTTNAPAARSSTEATRLPPLRPLPPSRVRWECCDPGTLFPWCLSQAWTTTCHGRLGPPEPASPPRSHPALARHRGDALRIFAASGVVESDHAAPPDLAVRRRRPGHARDRRPVEDRMAEHPPPRRGVRNHRRRPRGEVVLRPGLDGPRDARLVRSLARRELGLGRVAHDLPCGRQHRDPDISDRVDLAPHSRPTADLSAGLHHCDRIARGRDGLHQPPPHPLSALGLALPWSGGRGRVPRLGREEVRGSALGPIALETTSSIAARLCSRGFRVPNGLIPPLWRRTILRSRPDRHDPRRGRGPGGRNAPHASDLGRPHAVGPAAFRLRRGVHGLPHRSGGVPRVGRLARHGHRCRGVHILLGSMVPPNNRHPPRPGGLQLGPSRPRSPAQVWLGAQLDDDFLSRLRDENLLVSPKMQTALDIRRNSEDRPAPTTRELAPQLERLAPNAEPARDPNHPLTVLLGDEFFTARGTSEPLFHERVAFDFGGDVVDRDKPPPSALGTPGTPTTPRIP